MKKNCGDLFSKDEVLVILRFKVMQATQSLNQRFYEFLIEKVAEGARETYDVAAVEFLVETANPQTTPTGEIIAVTGQW